MTTPKGFPPLIQTANQIAKPGRASLVNNMIARANGQYERMSNRQAPGSGVKDWRAHDHSPGSAIVVPRGVIDCLDVGEDFTRWKLIVEGTSYAYGAEHDLIDTYKPHLCPYVTQGYDSGLDKQGGGTIGLTASILINLLCSVSPSTAELSIYNQLTETSATLDLLTSGTGLHRYKLTGIPCVGGRENPLELRVLADSTQPVTFELIALVLAEIDQLDSAGANTFGTVGRPT